MKKGLLLFAAITLFLATSFAQMPEEFSYQAVLRNADGSVIANQDITVVVEIIKGDIAGSSVFTETHNVSTTAQGVVSIVVGSIQDLSGVAWGSDNFFIKLSVNGVEIGTSQLLGVPYALHAKTADEIVGGVTETDPVFTAWDKSTGISINESQVTDLQNYLTNETDPIYSVSIASGITATDTAKWNTSNSLTETDPVFTAWDKTTGIEITENQISDLGNYIETETDPSVTANFDFTGAANGDLLQFNGTKWVKVTPNYISGYTVTESDVTAHQAALSVTESQISDLGNYLETETDPSVTATFDFTGAANGDLLQFNGTKWVKVTPDYNSDYTVTESDVTAHEAALEITESQISDLQDYLTSESDPAVSDNFDFTGAANGDLLQYNGTKWVKVTPDYISDYTVTESDVTAHEAALEITESQISDLQDYLTSESDPAVSDNFDFSGAANGDLLQYNGTKWVKVTPNYLTNYTENQSLEDVATIGNSVNTQIKNITNPTDAQDAATKAYVDELRTLLYLTVDVDKLIASGVAVENLIDAGVSVIDLLDAGVSVTDLLDAGVSVTDLLDAGVSVTDLLDAGVSVADLLDAGVSVADLFAVGVGVGVLEQNGVTPQQLTDAGLIGTVSDIDGNEYKWVKIGTQMWMAENLKVTKYQNGSSIPVLASAASWSSTSSGAYSIFPYSSISGLNTNDEVKAAYGLLYNWYAVIDVQGLCPSGWHVPSRDEWMQLIDYIVTQGYPNIDPNSKAGNSLKSCRQENSPLEGICATTEHPRWDSNINNYGANDFGFSSLPSGMRNKSGVFQLVGENHMLFTSTQSAPQNAFGYFITYYQGTVTVTSVMDKNNGLSVRCIKD